MLLSKYINRLKEILEKEGDLEIIYASDDEGNSYQKVCYHPSIAYFKNLSNYDLIKIDKTGLEKYPNAKKAIIIN